MISKINPETLLSLAQDAEGKHRRGLCVTRHCRKAHAPGRRRCYKCDKALYRLRNPVRYAFENLRRSANLRGIGFALSFEDFQDFCAASDYDPERRGCRPGALTVERVDPLRPYEPGNLRCLEFMENSAKGWGPDRDRHRGQAPLALDGARGEEEPF